MDSMDSMDNEKMGIGKKQLQPLVWLCCLFFFAAVMDRREIVSGPRER